MNPDTATYRAAARFYSAADLLGPSPSGHIKRAYADLVTWGVIVPPARRWPTEAGLRLLEQT